MLAGEGLLEREVGLGGVPRRGFRLAVEFIPAVNRQSFHWGMDLHLPWQLLAEFVAVMLAPSTPTPVASRRQAMGGDVVGAVQGDWWKARAMPPPGVLLSAALGLRPPGPLAPED